MNTDKEFTLHECAVLADCHVNTIRGAVKTGKLAAHRHKHVNGVPWMVSAVDLAEYMIQRNEQYERRKTNTRKRSL